MRSTGTPAMSSWNTRAWLVALVAVAVLAVAAFLTPELALADNSWC